MEQNIQLSCEVVRDLLPLYHDKVVSKDTETAIENHLDICGECLKEYNKISTELPEQKRSKFKADVGKVLKRIKTKAFIKGVLITCLIAVIIIGGYFSLFKLKISKLSPDEIKVEHAYKTDDGIFLIYDLPRFGGVAISFMDEGNSLELVFKEAIFNSAEEKKFTEYIDFKKDDCDNLKINGKNIELETENIPEYVTEHLSFTANPFDSDKQIIGECFDGDSTIHFHYNDGTEKIWKLDGTLIYEGSDKND